MKMAKNKNSVASGVKLFACVLWASSMISASTWAQQASSQGQIAPSSPESLQAPKISIGPGDLLDIEVFDTPELSGTSRVNQSGEVNLSVVGTIHLAGLNASEASHRVEEELRARGLMIDPHVTVSISEYASQGATLMGEIRSPGIYPTLGSRKLLDMLALAGGPTPLAGKTATVIHRDDPTHPIDVALATNAKSLADQQNPVIFPGDTVVIAKAGLIYILGDVGKPGGFLIDNNEHLSLMQALTLAGGYTKTSATHETRLIRHVPEGREEIKLDLKKIAYGKEADLKVMDGDILFIPSSLIKTLGYRGLEAAIVAAQQAAVYAAYQ
jgi:polysaccharide export outer membrane protein